MWGTLCRAWQGLDCLVIELQRQAAAALRALAGDQARKNLTRIHLAVVGGVIANHSGCCQLFEHPIQAAQSDCAVAFQQCMKNLVHIHGVLVLSEHMDGQQPWLRDFEARLFQARSMHQR